MHTLSRSFLVFFSQFLGPGRRGEPAARVTLDYGVYRRRPAPAFGLAAMGLAFPLTLLYGLQASRIVTSNQLGRASYDMSIVFYGLWLLPVSLAAAAVWRDERRWWPLITLVLAVVSLVAMISLDLTSGRVPAG